MFEYAAGALQIAIVLGSAAVVTQLASVAVAGGVIGALAVVLALVVGGGLV